MKLPFAHTQTQAELERPSPVVLPRLRGADIAALYRAARVGGDFYDFVSINDLHLVFVLLDIAGKREQAFHIAAAAQKQFRVRVRALFSQDDFNEADSLTELMHTLNHAIMEAAGGVRCSQAFLACYDQELGVLHYINAGHTPGLVKDSGGVYRLAATGLPLGLFSHATHDAQFFALEPGAGLLLVSKGLVEARARGEEFSLERVQQVLTERPFSGAQQLCSFVLEEVNSFVASDDHHAFHVPAMGHRRLLNDITTLALTRGLA